MRNSRLGLQRVVEESKKKQQERRELEEQNEKEERNENLEQSVKAFTAPRDRKILNLQDKKTPSTVVRGEDALKSEKKSGPVVEANNRKKVVSKPSASSNKRKIVTRPSSPSSVERAKGETKISNFSSNSERPPRKKEKFEDTHKRFTNYLELELYEGIQSLKDKGEIESLTAVLNAAIYEYLTKYFPKEHHS